MGTSDNVGRAQGHRSGRWTAGKVPPNRVAWVEFSVGKLAVNQYLEREGSAGDADDTETQSSVNADLGPSVSLLLNSRFDTKTIKFILTNLTGPELDAFEKILRHAINLARPSVEIRDRLAKEAFSNGDDSYERVYRALPSVAIREGKK